MKISIVVPLFNERESLTELFTGIAVVLDRIDSTYEVIYVDDGSNDGSFDTVCDIKKQYPTKVIGIRFSRNFGKSAALAAGIDAARGDIIVTMDSDLQDDPTAIPEMLKKIEEGYDVISGWKKKRFDPVLSKNIPSKVFNLFTSWVSGVKLHDFNCGFKMYRAEAAKSLEIYGERHRYLPALAHWNGYKVTEVVVTHHQRKYGVTKFGLNRFLNGPFDLLTIVFLRKYLKNPLHFFGALGLIFGFLGCAVLAYFGIEWITSGNMRIRPLVLLSMGSVIMGIQFISIGLLGEMITHSSPKKTFTIRDTTE
jgi:glycosyltransferase involved in cell wall biosynthesis